MPIRGCRRSGLRVMLPPHLAAAAAAELGADAGRCRAIRGAPHRARRAAGRRSISAMATPSRTRPTWTSSAASISPKAAMSARKSSRAWSTAAPRAPARCRCATTAPRPQAGAAVTAGDRQLGTMGSAAAGRGGCAVAARPRGRAMSRGEPLVERRRADPSGQAGLGALCLSRRNQGRRMKASSR